MCHLVTSKTSQNTLTHKRQDDVSRECFHKNLNVGLVFCFLYLGIPNKLYKCNIE